MPRDKRKSIRRPLRYSAWIALDGGELHGCVLSDISKTGARIDTVDSKLIPDQFTLLLSNNGSATRMCSVAWRKSRQVGVTFERRIRDTEQATLVPKSDADTAGAPATEAAKDGAKPAEST
jgi:hypothetical protein